jgi:2-oxoglutarate dehydrogenase E1 component
LQELANRLNTLPDGLALHSRVNKIVEDRRKMAAGALPIDWGFAETMSYASLLHEGYDVRLSGQDSGRGTFAHRHAVLHNQTQPGAHVPLREVADGNFLVIDSVLSEEAVLAFEYGYATADPNTLVLWEAQFGDFANGAQVVIDQFISSGETKWGRLCGLTLLLPHGYEGQGPEHSSARIERFLQLCAEDNMCVLVPSTPAQCYHMLRRQMTRPMRRPLIVMTPKSLLRHRLATSTLEDLSDGRFQPVIDEIDDIATDKVDRLVFCAGKVYYDLLEARREAGADNVAIARLEQLYPFPYDDMTATIARYPSATSIVWCQEEPRNQGAWRSNRHRIERVLPATVKDVEFVGRMPSASPASGYMSQHLAEQKQLVQEALGLVANSQSL